MADYYELLGATRGASDAELKKAYHKMVMKHHPDRNPGDKGAEAKFKEINQAYDVLRDPQKRAAYDQFGESAFNGGGNPGAGGGRGGAGAGGFGGGGFGGFGGGGFGFDDLGDIFEQFGFGGGGARRETVRRGRDLLHDISIDLATAFTGTSKNISFTAPTKCEKCGGNGTADGTVAPICAGCGGSGVVRVRRGIFMSENTCPECNGTGRKIKNPCGACGGGGVKNERRTIDIKIPAGIENGARLRVRGGGESAPFGGESGDLFIDISVAQHDVFDRRSADLAMSLSVPFTTLCLGGKIKVGTIDGGAVEVVVAAGTQIGDDLRLRGKGMPDSARGGFGDLYATITTDVPKKLSADARESLEKFASQSTPKKSKKGWF